MDGWDSESYIPTFLIQEYANGEIVDRDSLALTSEDPRVVRVYNSDVATISAFENFGLLLLSILITISC